MSLSLLNAYNSSDESDEDETSISKDLGKIDPSKEENSKKETSKGDDDNSETGKNYFAADSSDEDEDEDDGEWGKQQESALPANFPPLPMMPNPYDSAAPTGPLYGPPHPSQMYNHASQASNYDDPSASTSSTTDFEQAYSDEAGPSSAKRYRGMLTDDQAKRLIKKFEMDSMNLAMPDRLEIIDAHVDTHLGNVRENLVKNITTIPTASAAAAAMLELQGGGSGGAQGEKGKKGKGGKGKPDGMAKRKNQITYLAHMAKANEEKLQNDWAANRLTKRQTQAKYGF